MDKLIDEVRGVVELVIGREVLATNDEPLVFVGVDSRAASAVSAALCAKYPFLAPPKVLLADHPTLGAIAAWISRSNPTGPS